MTIGRCSVMPRSANLVTVNLQRSAGLNLIGLWMRYRVCAIGAATAGVALMSFRYYLYVSDVKVDMLLSQLYPSFQDRRTSEWSLNFKIFGAKRGRETAVGDNRFARLETVVRYLEDHGDVGSVDEPGQFFRGLLPMKWGPLKESKEPQGFYFCGHTDRTILGLVGSTDHVIGAGSSRPSDRPSALLGYAVPPLTEALGNDDDKGDIDSSPTDVSAEQGAINAVHYATSIFPGPEQNLEFVAKRLIRGRSLLPDEPEHPHSERMVLLGTPLYVALVE